MATQPKLTQWFDTPSASSTISAINPADFAFVLVRGIPCDTYQWRPINGIGFAIEADLEEALQLHVEAEAGFLFEDARNDHERREYLDFHRTQVSVADVIRAAIERKLVMSA